MAIADLASPGMARVPAVSLIVARGDLVSPDVAIAPAVSPNVARVDPVSPELVRLQYVQMWRCAGFDDRALGS
jgi:hypothetical protein